MPIMKSKIEEVFGFYRFLLSGKGPCFFNDQDLAHFSSTSKTLYSAAKYELTQRAAKKLVTYVVLGKQNEAHAMIKIDPELLLILSITVDYSGRIIIATPFQAAIGAGDKLMWKMMLPYFDWLKSGEALRQYHAWFPEGIEDPPASTLQAQYDAIAFAIIHDKDHGLSKIEAFRKEITSQKEITQGNHFNLQHLVAAYEAYITNFYVLDALDTWDNRNLFWQKVIGYVQRQMTAYDAQSLCSGVHKILNNKESFLRSFKLYEEGEFFPLQDNSGLGHDFAVFNTRLGPWTGGQARAIPSDVHSAAIKIGCCWELKNYAEQKRMNLLDLKNHLSKECIINSINRVKLSIKEGDDKDEMLEVFSNNSQKSPIEESKPKSIIESTEVIASSKKENVDYKLHPYNLSENIAVIERLKDAVMRAQKEYKSKYDENMFHSFFKHGKSGQKKAIAFSDKIMQLLDAGEQAIHNKLISFLLKKTTSYNDKKSFSNVLLKELKTTGLSPWAIIPDDEGSFKRQDVYNILNVHIDEPKMMGNQFS